MLMKTGYSKAIITPEKPMKMAGYDKRQGESRGTHDDLFARCLLIDCGSRLTVLMSLDVLGVDEQLSARIKSALIHECRGMAEEGIFICATHTHSGPGVLFHNNVNFDPEYEDHIVRKCIEAFLCAESGRKESRLYAGTSNIYGVASKRNKSDIEDRNTGIKCSYIRITGHKSEIMVINFPCHMTVLDESNILYSRDMLDGMEKALKIGGIDQFIFINGAAGDISTRFFKAEPSFEEADRLGRLLAGQILDNRDLELKEIDIHSYTAKEIELLLEYKTNLTVEDKKSKIDEIEYTLSNMSDSRMKRDLESAMLVLKRPDRNYDNLYGVFKDGDRYYKKVKINMVSFGGLALIGLPFEIFYDTGISIERMLKRKYGCSHVLLSGYCGGYDGYIPPQQEFSRISYEATACIYETDAEKSLLSAIENF